jgi:hypothetical protein
MNIGAPTMRSSSSLATLIPLGPKLELSVRPEAGGQCGQVSNQSQGVGPLLVTAVSYGASAPLPTISPVRAGAKTVISKSWSIRRALPHHRGKTLRLGAGRVAVSNHGRSLRDAGLVGVCNGAAFNRWAGMANHHQNRLGNSVCGYSAIGRCP